MNRWAILFASLFVLLGPLPLVLGAWFTWTDWTEHRREVDAQAGWIADEARTVGCTPIRRDTQTGDWSFRYDIEWSAPDGQTRRHGGGGGSCTEGGRYPIRYDPANLDAFAPEVTMFIPVPMILCAIGVGFTSIGVKEWWKARRAA